MNKQYAVNEYNIYININLINYFILIEDYI